jgi:hypothetical protein
MEGDSAMTQSIVEQIAAHTPTPWLLDQNMLPDVIYSTDAHWSIVARCSGVANAAFIVQACNAYDGFVALQRAVDGYLGAVDAMAVAFHSDGGHQGNEYAKALDAYDAALSDLRLAAAAVRT